ncbi:MAG: hypothetical protein LBV12_08985 [Puniceicoccales bacterium]|jgi:hypothetical protein|nr:hypothetical protein [Puniceicoccales bacterium]
MKNKIIATIVTMVVASLSIHATDINRPSADSGFSMNTVCSFVWESQENKAGEWSQTPIGNRYVFLSSISPKSADVLKKTAEDQGRCLQLNWSGQTQITGDATVPFGSKADLIDPASGNSRAKSKRFALIGEVKYQNTDAWFLEGWFEFVQPNGKRISFFSKALQEGGLMGKLKGTCTEWRDFVLPFDAAQPDPEATKDWLLSGVTFNVCMAGNGTASVRNLKLVEFEGLTKNWVSAVVNSSSVKEMTDALSMSRNPWWSDRSAGVIGGLGGTVYGIFGTLILVLIWMRKCLDFVKGALITVIVIGVISFIAGLVAYAMRQPYEVYYPLLLLGVVSILCDWGGLWYLSILRLKSERRKMESMDI